MDPRVPFWSVRIEGEDVSSWVSSVQLVEDDQQADNVALTMPDPRMAWADAVMEGSHAEIDLGYADRDQHALLLRATLTRVETSYPEGGVPELKLKGEDKSIQMGLEERTRLWRDTTVAGVVREVAKPYGFARVEVALAPDPKVARQHQDGKTDLAFLQELAKEYHAKCFVELDENDREVLYFIPERRVVTIRRPETLVLRYRQGPGSTLRSFSPTFDASYLDRLREVHDVDDEGQSVASPTAQPTDVTAWDLAPDLRSRVSPADWRRLQTIYDAGMRQRTSLQQALTAVRPAPGRVARDQADLDARTDRLESRRLGMSARGSTIGSIWLRAKSAVVITGVHQRFAGEWYVTAVTHSVGADGFTSDFTCVR